MVRAPVGRGILGLVSLTLIACGLKADPRGVDQVRPKTITSLVGELGTDGVHLAWQRPATYVNGQRMDDIGGFLVFRGLPGQQAEQIAEVPVAVSVVSAEQLQTANITNAESLDQLVPTASVLSAGAITRYFPALSR